LKRSELVEELSKRKRRSRRRVKLDDRRRQANFHDATGVEEDKEEEGTNLNWRGSSKIARDDRRLRGGGGVGFTIGRLEAPMNRRRQASLGS